MALIHKAKCSATSTAHRCRWNPTPVPVLTIAAGSTSEASAAIEAAGATPDEAERKAQYQIACEAIDAELPHVYLYDRSDIHLSRSNIVNFDVNPWDNQTWNAAEWDKE